MAKKDKAVVVLKKGYQLMFQFPEAFEFNMDLLLFITFHHNSCLYGNFMYNNELERFEKKAKFKTSQRKKMLLFAKIMAFS